MEIFADDAEYDASLGFNAGEDESISEEEYDDNEGQLNDTLYSRWRRVPLENVPVSISRNGIQDFLLKTAQKEMKEVSRRLIRSLGTLDATPSNVCSILLTPLLAVLKSAMRRTSTEDTVDISDSDVVEFIRSLIILSFYSETPTNFFNEELREYFPLAGDRCHSTFRKCMKALSSCTVVHISIIL